VKLPGADRAVVEPEKVRDYLLSPAHSVGKLKAAFFNALGYNQDDWTRLQADLLHIATLDIATQGRFTRYGNKYEIRATLTGPNGRSARVLTAWIVGHGQDFPRLITAFPDDMP